MVQTCAVQLPRAVHDIHLRKFFVFLDIDSSECVSVQAYSTILAIISLTVKSLSTFAARYNISVLLVAFFVYCYRDLWPLATLYDAPKDRSEGVLLWVKIALLGLTAIIIPLFIPRRYTPVDPNVGSTLSLHSFVSDKFPIRIPCQRLMMSKPALSSL